MLRPIGQVLMLSSQQVEHDGLRCRHHDDRTILATADQTTLHRQKDGRRKGRVRR